MARLERPAAQYRDTYLDALREAQAEGMRPDLDAERIAADFDAYVRHLLKLDDPAYIPPDRVPANDFWLIDGETLVGWSSLRHSLTPALLRWGGHIGYQIRPSARRRGYGKEILRLTLIEARSLGLQRVLVTCDETNIGSKKIIEANGGVFENAVDGEGQTVKKLRYWIDPALSSPANERRVDLTPDP